MPARPARPPVLLVAVVAAGGALGALLRWSLGLAVPDGGGLPLTTAAINVVGSLALSLLPALALVRRHEALAVGLGPGVLGGFTTLSTATEQTRALLAAGDLVRGVGYAALSLAACLAAVELGSRLTSRREQRLFAAEGGDE